MTTEENNLIEIETEDGSVIKCELYDIIEFEGKEYGLLVEESDLEDDEPEVVLMRYIEEGEEVFFEPIEDDEEFEKVQAYVESLEPIEEDEDEE
jgi:CYTH domain-containing protein